MVDSSRKSRTNMSGGAFMKSKSKGLYRIISWMLIFTMVFSSNAAVFAQAVETLVSQDQEESYQYDILEAEEDGDQNNQLVEAVHLTYEKDGLLVEIKAEEGGSTF